MIQSNYARFVRLCVHYLGNHELSGPSVCIVSWGQQDTPRSAKQFVKMFHLFEPRKNRYYYMYIYWVIYAQKTEIDIQLYKTKRT